MRKITAIILLFLVGQLLFGQDSIEHAQVYYNNAWRIIDKNGNFILNQGYGVDIYECLCFTDKVAISYKNKKVGFVDFSNNQIIENKFDNAHCFQLGFASVAVGDKWGIINRKGEFIVDPIYDYAGNFGLEGVAGIIKDNKIALVDTNGKFITPFKYYFERSFMFHPDYPVFVNGLLSVIEADSYELLHLGKMGFINSKGEMVIPPVFHPGPGFFIDGMATVHLDGEIIVIDTLGKILLRPSGIERGLLYFDDGYSIFEGEDGVMGIMKIDGEIIFKGKYANINYFSEGFASVQLTIDENGEKSVFIDTNGNFVFDKTFGSVHEFNEGYASVEINGKWGYIDQTGAFVIEPQFDEAWNFFDGLAIVALKNGKQTKYGYIDTTGKFVLEPIYNAAYPFEYGLAPVMIGNKFGYIDSQGKIVIKPKFKIAFGFQREQLGWTK